ncbi:MAG: hypothetical protein HFJ32_01525 [Clostridia bacterium]|nr:hypothetical protein [Clostridia bacterium]
MIVELMNYLKDKKVIILGFGREGKSTYKLIRNYLKDQLIYIADQKENFEKTEELLQNDKNIICYSRRRIFRSFRRI